MSEQQRDVERLLEDEESRDEMNKYYVERGVEYFNRHYHERATLHEVQSWMFAMQRGNYHAEVIITPHGIRSQLVDGRNNVPAFIRRSSQS